MDACVIVSDLEAAVRALLKNYQHAADGVTYGVALWSVESPDEDPGVLGRLSLTAAPIEPSDVLLQFCIQLTASDATDPQQLYAALDRALAGALRERSMDEEV